MLPCIYSARILDVQILAVSKDVLPILWLAPFAEDQPEVNLLESAYSPLITNEEYHISRPTIIESYNEIVITVQDIVDDSNYERKKQ